VIEISALDRPSEHSAQVRKDVVGLAWTSALKEPVGHPRDVAPAAAGLSGL
jgi:hypothetical protein